MFGLDKNSLLSNFEKMAKYELFYWNFGGRAAPIRMAFLVGKINKNTHENILLLQSGGIEFQDTRMSMEEFEKIKQDG